jgi:peptidoglycan/LPS O-acetylase OafA/YrhL
VLSGFLITSLLCDEMDRHGTINLTSFMARRVLRLMPALLLLIAVFASLSLMFLDEAKARSNLIDSAISMAYLSNWARAFGWHAPDHLGHTWSLAIEEQFYLLWPLVLLAVLKFGGSRARAAYVAVVIALASISWRTFLLQQGATAERLFNGLDTRADGLMIGCALALVLNAWPVDTIKLALARPLTALAPLALVALASFAQLSDWREPYMHRWGFALVCICTATVIAHVVINENGRIARAFSAGWLRWFGEISYGLYLWHYPVYRLLREHGATRMQVVIWGSLIALAIALLSFHLLEKPMQKLKRRFERRGLAGTAVEAPTIARASLPI